LPIDAIFAAMQNKGHIALGQMVSGITMIIALLWLTISTPFVYSSQQEYRQLVKDNPGKYQDNNPFAGTTEEKNESSVNNLSEYLHDVEQLDKPSSLVENNYKLHDIDPDHIYHPEVLSPPPKAWLMS
jgi:hypothetical protein